MRGLARILTGIVIGAALGYAAGFGHGKHIADEDWSRRTITGVAVDCYDDRGGKIADDFAKFGGVTTACAPGQTAKIHQPK
jgi:hypothetical protein